MRVLFGSETASCSMIQWAGISSLNPSGAVRQVMEGSLVVEPVGAANRASNPNLVRVELTSHDEDFNVQACTIRQTRVISRNERCMLVLHWLTNG